MTRFRVTEGDGLRITGTVLGGTGTAVNGNSITSAKLTLYDQQTEVLDGSPRLGIINSRDEYDLLLPSPAEITIGTDGVFTWDSRPADNVIVTPLRQIERHIATIEFVWSGGSYTWQGEIDVVNLRITA